MKKFAVTLMMFLGVIGVAVSPRGYAQEEADIEPAVEEPAGEPMMAGDVEEQYSYGVVVSTAAEQLVLLEYDYEQDADVEVSYAINADTKLENVGSVTEIAKDDNVEVLYVEKDGQKIATQITKEERIEETEEVMDEEGTEVPVEVPGMEVPAIEEMAPTTPDTEGTEGTTEEGTPSDSRT